MSLVDHEILVAVIAASWKLLRDGNSDLCIVAKSPEAEQGPHWVCLVQESVEGLLLDAVLSVGQEEHPRFGFALGDDVQRMNQNVGLPTTNSTSQNSAQEIGILNVLADPFGGFGLVAPLFFGVFHDPIITSFRGAR